MQNKTCEDCKSFPGMGYYCPIIGRFCDPNNEKPCEFFEKPMGRIATNGDRIREMSNEELKKFLTLFSLQDCKYCAYSQVDGRFVLCQKTKNNNCVDGLMEWLNAPAESEEEEVSREICDICGNEFVWKKGMAYCSYDCEQKARQKLKQQAEKYQEK